MVSEKVFQKDPVRLIRAYRMAAALGFEIDSRTASAIKKDARLIRDSAGERIHAELFKIFGTPQSHYYFSLMAESGLLFEIFPEIRVLKGCLQNRYHHYDVFKHTMKAYYHLETLLNAPNFSFSSSGLETEPSEPVNETIAAMLKCAILLHDIGKPLTRTVGSDGTVHFYNHEHKGADMMLTLGERLKFSTREIRFTEFIIRNHIRPLYLFRGYEIKRLTQKSITRFFMKCGEHTPWLLLHSVADNRGKGDEKDERTQAFTAFAKQLLADFFSDFTPRKSEPPLITGRDLIQKFGLEPSPLFKTLLNLVEEERLSKRIASRTEALERVKSFLENDE
jgi:putative nucleotidyltransferase with HDIG domain